MNCFFTPPDSEVYSLKVFRFLFLKKSCLLKDFIKGSAMYIVYIYFFCLTKKATQRYFIGYTYSVLAMNMYVDRVKISSNKQLFIMFVTYLVFVVCFYN